MARSITVDATVSRPVMNSPAETQRQLLDHDICVHIFTASAAMVGVCLTVIGIIRMVVSLRHTDVLGDDLLAINAMAYLGACLMSYWALRTRSLGRNHRLERIADVLFLAALTLTAVNAAFITWAVSAFR
jgi:threonine/homoserine/homoserine lactone efflux protein